MSISIVVVDDHSMVRDGIVKLLATCRDVEVVGQAKDGFEAHKMATELQPDVVLMDLYMPGSSRTRYSRQDEQRDSDPPGGV